MKLVIDINEHLYKTIKTMGLVVEDGDAVAVSEAILNGTPLKAEPVVLSGAMDEDVINEMIAEITRLRVKLYASEMHIFDGYCPYRVTSNFDEVCKFDDCNDCKRVWIQNRLEETQKEVLEEYKIQREVNTNEADN